MVQLRRTYVYMFVVSSLVCTYLGITTNKAFQAITSTNDKVAHFVVFMWESWLFVKMFAEDTVTFRKLQANKYVLGVLICSLCASVTSEFAQSVVSRGQRVFDVKDIICNFWGSLLGVGIAFYQDR
ncbi:hypothetical protein H788_YJM1248J00295 [Saccharomyces cerevisiae YJM1248]|nr:hypothetical protein H749_YJM195J00327 [Saccharomyces cerevisiae YJM195]AJR65417.1 hypothetical protein H765_YJM627J00326 [Saccharomyces cerevisiae YJM627]AJR67673.1 hypothetical protein H788_YJM1248J00295 [Saccharomyces cerevisiae YJM1248]AJR70603.1 hypothetical protein H820_YJM1439J00326 [Saccharomyces cerevisiae YJM1439]AJR73548.1 hypothetical protein H829_YJM1479J00327 [Saccharomyces cerevisiae YJM1479]AJV45377.1 hypothetical protein H811_YJM1400J00327 [Saccharomyces cerevisiae YJM1400]